MTCNGCVAKAKSELLKLGDVAEADVQLTAPQATVTMLKHIPVEDLQTALKRAGNFTIAEVDGGMHYSHPAEANNSWFQTYKPLFIIGGYISGITFLFEFAKGAFSWETWMSNFMAGFFLSFSFFKFLDLRGFAGSYSSYDIVARHWPAWGYVYAFIELFLGFAYLIKFSPLFTNGVTFTVMSISIVGVLQSVLNNRKIRCACLGAVFNLPMSTITVVEDALMIAMSAAMIISTI